MGPASTMEMKMPKQEVESGMEKMTQGTKH